MHAGVHRLAKSAEVFERRVEGEGAAVLALPDLAEGVLARLAQARLGVVILDELPHLRPDTAARKRVGRGGRAAGGRMRSCAQGERRERS